MLDFYDQHHLLYERSTSMNAVCRYLFCVISAVVLCGIIQILIPGEKNSLMQLVTGIAIAVIALQPILTNQQFSIDKYFYQFTSDSDAVVNDGISAGNQANSEFIKAKSEAYILDKAEQLGADISVDIVLSDTEYSVPVEITVCGLVSPYIRQQLSTYIENDLGISEDGQIWTS